ncbi:hypothetical protein BDN72DRAFT_896475 [Pluteus cervinus]|uniref:Uncharacterized protein n=1 Tax=Pluteus cervinus TaxID=181527 RepID=A0ACD3AXM9_9AGAR|nr:hypothetical protein BDN72DRAFT_896475 [Pluteus cervinus]
MGDSLLAGLGIRTTPLAVSEWANKISLGVQPWERFPEEDGFQLPASTTKRAIGPWLQQNKAKINQHDLFNPKIPMLKLSDLKPRKILGHGKVRQTPGATPNSSSSCPSGSPPRGNAMGTGSQGAKSTVPRRNNINTLTFGRIIKRVKMAVCEILGASPRQSSGPLGNVPAMGKNTSSDSERKLRLWRRVTRAGLFFNLGISKMELWKKHEGVQHEYVLAHLAWYPQGRHRDISLDNTPIPLSTFIRLERNPSSTTAVFAPDLEIKFLGDAIFQGPASSSMDSSAPAAVDIFRAVTEGDCLARLTFTGDFRPSLVDLMAAAAQLHNGAPRYHANSMKCQCSWFAQTLMDMMTTLDGINGLKSVEQKSKKMYDGVHAECQHECAPIQVGHAPYIPFRMQARVEILITYICKVLEGRVKIYQGDPDTDEGS